MEDGREASARWSKPRPVAARVGAKQVPNKQGGGMTRHPLLDSSLDSSLTVL